MHCQCIYEEDNIEISTCSYVSHLEFTPFAADPKSYVHTTHPAPVSRIELQDLTRISIKIDLLTP